MKKIIAVFLLVSMLFALCSCGGDATDNAQKPYGIDDRFIGTWVEVDGRGSVMLFLPNGIVYGVNGNGEEWYTATGNILVLWDNVYEYKFDGNDKFTMSYTSYVSENVRTFIRTDEHFAHIAH